MLLCPLTCNVANYADNSTLYATEDCFKKIIEELPADLISFMSWLPDYIMIYFKKLLVFAFRKNYWRFLKTNSQKLSEFMIDHKLNFEEHLKTI